VEDFENDATAKCAFDRDEYPRHSAAAELPLDVVGSS
jgi:hypothetical protein